MSSPNLPVSRVLKHLVVMCSVAAVLGVVVAGLAIPFAGLVGLGASKAAKTMDELPADFKVGDLDQTTRILDAKGNLITTLYDQNRVYRPLKQVSRKMSKAILSIEDYRFYQHGALDLKGTLRAFITNEANSGTVQGGSSITQQLVKMTLLYKARGNKKLQKEATADTYARKLKELRYAIALEQKHSKDWILEHYLNAAYFGDSAYGIQAAAKHYFNVNADQLSWDQAALLAGLVKNPSGYDPTNYPDAAIARRNVVLDRMAQLGVISQQKAEKLKKKGLGLDVQKSTNGCVSSTAPFFCQYVVAYLEQDQALGDTVKERKNALYRGGLTIKTTLRPAFQSAADKSVHSHVAATDNAIGAIAMIEPGTGYVRAVSQSRPMGANSKKGETYLNYVVPSQYGNANGFQAGSTFKLFVLSSAIQYNKLPLNQVINSPAEKTIANANFAGCPGDGVKVGEHTWHNSTSSGAMTAYTGTQLSVNTYFAQVEEMTGLCKPYKLAQAMGVQLSDPVSERVPTFTLGVADVSPLEMAEAYATVAARGKHCDALPVTEISDSSGVVKRYKSKCQQVMNKTTADAVNDILRGVQEAGGFGGSAGLGLTAKDGSVLPSAAKTGTIDSNMAVWYDGYTPSLATVSMIAGANSAGHWVTLNGQSLNGSYVETAHGSTTAGPMWGDAMHAIQRLLPDEDFVAPTQAVIKGDEVTIPSVGGLSVSAATAKLRAAGFKVSVGGSTYSSYSYGTVAGTSPSGSAAKGSPVTLYTSAGSAPQKNNNSGGKKKGNGNGKKHGRG
ncbi:MAG: transglycosylase domain-containing protein [Nocardioides sp.]|uniref:penicillin-binding protein n=1 Tax=Nocardioides sp. TaxID=35761 RepID=UPI0039E2567F